MILLSLVKWAWVKRADKETIDMEKAIWLLKAQAANGKGWDHTDSQSVSQFMPYSTFFLLLLWGLQSLSLLRFAK